MDKKPTRNKSFKRKTYSDNTRKHETTKKNVLYNKRFSTLKKKRKRAYDPKEEARYARDVKMIRSLMSSFTL